MLGGATSLFQRHGHLPEAERHLYQAEREDNFRWVSQFFAQPAPEPLKSTDLVDISLQDELSEIGQFAEVAHGSIKPAFIWEYMAQLSEPDYPIHNYPALSKSRLLSIFHGSASDLQAYIAYRPEIHQLVVAFSGTSSLAQGFQALNAKMVPHPSGGGCRVHSGFWSMYSGIRIAALFNLRKALGECDVREVVVTGHSMGAAIGSLFCLDILEERASQSDTSSVLFSQKIKVVAFGAPRVGNLAFAQLWRELTGSFEVVEYSIRIYNDGVPTMPPHCIGYRHVSSKPIYFAYGRLWNILPAQSEHSLFKFAPEAIENADKAFPLGGHNYYNGRDMELLQRRLKWFEPHAEDDTWDVLKRRFEDKLSQEQEASFRVR